MAVSLLPAEQHMAAAHLQLQIAMELKMHLLAGAGALLAQQLTVRSSEYLHTAPLKPPSACAGILCSE